MMIQRVLQLQRAQPGWTAQSYRAGQTSAVPCWAGPDLVLNTNSIRALSPTAELNILHRDGNSQVILAL